MYNLTFFLQKSLSEEVGVEITGGKAVILPGLLDSVEVHKEEFAYTTLSLVADVGGVLGMFIGFNFLMFWDWIVWGIQQIQNKLF